MTNKIFVGNLSFQLTDFDLEDLFKQYGEVTSAKVVIDRMTGRSKGFGFVEMGTEDGAKQAIEALNGTELNGRPVNVSFARNQDNERKSFRGSGGYHKRRSNRDF